MTSVAQEIPEYLRRYCVPAASIAYTEEEHATWRYIMRQNLAFFSKHAVPVYRKGLELTGIGVDRIPQIRDIDRLMHANLGWRAVPVRGFIPPAAFLDFQARKILPIASDMRRVGNILYTPAPDIVHEAAGHAPIIADPEYSRYLTLYANVAKKAIMSIEDLAMFEAIRELSDVKESPEATAEGIERAEARLVEVTAAISYVSEAAKVARMYWWTAEYGLSGSLSAPKIFGAGLLSSVGESQACLGPGVKKLPLTVACVDQSYDITRPQPQLFVADDSKHLAHVLAEYEATMAYRVGGAAGLAEARRARTVVTVILGAARDAQAPPLQGEPVGPGVSGVVKDFTIDGDGKVVAVVFSGKTQVGYEGHQLDGGGVGEQPVDVLVPVGRFRFLVGREPARVTDAELAAAGVAPAKHGKLELASGLAVEGYVERFVHEKGALIAIGWRDAVVKQDGKVLRAATAGERWLMPVGTEVISVYAGSQDEMLFSTFDFGTTTTIPGRQRPFTKEETDRFADYARVRAARETVAGRAGGKLDTAAVEELAAIGARHKDDWLLRLEVVETAMLSALPEAEVWRRALHDDFPDPERQRLVSKGLEVLQ